MTVDGTTHKANVASYFDHTAPYWETVYAADGETAGSFGAHAKQRRRDLVLARLDAYAGRRCLSVLDVGCGPGIFLEAVALRGHRVAGIDLSAAMVRKAGERLAKFGDAVFACRRGDLERIPMESGTVDVVLCLGVLPYLADDRQGVAEMLRVLKAGGLAIVILPNLFRLGSLADPYYYLVRSWHYLRYRLRGPAAMGHTPLDPAAFNANRDFGVRRYTMGEAAGIFARQGAGGAEQVAGIDFGPPTCWRKSLLPPGRAITFSRLLERRAAGWPWLHRLANEWVLCFRKPS